MILVAGGTGHLGSVVVERLRARDLGVRVLTRDAERAHARLGPDVELAVGDAGDGARLADALGGVDVVTSAMTGFGPGAQGTQVVDRDGNLNLFQAAEAAGVRRFVLVSMHGASEDHQMGLLRMKHLAEQALRSSTLEWVILRPNVFTELWIDIVGGPILKSGKATVFGRGENPINFNSINDVARFCEMAITDPALGRTALSIGGPDNLTFNQFVERIGRAAGRSVSVRHIPRAVMQVSAAALRRLKPDIAGLIEAGIAMDSADMAFDASGLQERFPEVGLTSLDDVLRRRFGTPIPEEGAAGRRQPAR